ncbi:MAG: 4Fe-4S dicluster domain-containing protein [Syntrophales bacterium]|jgi:heterodisulfide reductase subunit C|nr:4Fe-4S dicluster domain-containing protein [Syntrophales bacterium]
MNLNEAPSKTNNSFLEDVIKASNVNIQACYQCQKCSAGCPVVSAMDIMPNQVVRQIQYGRREKVLSSKTIWICASCHTCSVRCPNDIDIAKVMDTLRHISLKSGLKAGEGEIPIFHSVFLDSIKATGRIHELSLILRFKLKTRDFLKDAALGWEMFRRGKIKILPQSFTGGRDIKGIFRAYEKGRGI